VRVLWLSLLATLALPAAGWAQRPPIQQQRRALERQILQRFVQQSADEMRLAPERRDQLERWLTESTRERRTLAEQATVVRRRLADAVQNPRTSDAEFERILGDLDQLRQREYELWKRDEAELARTLTPRQRAHFAIRLLRLQEMIDERRDGPDGGGQPPPGGDYPTM
jgi:Spy/CpxP family protein refolding chaperone